MVFTKTMSHGQRQRHGVRSCRLWLASLLLAVFASAAWAQPGLPVPVPIPLLGAEATGVDATANTMENFTLPIGSTLSGTVTDAAGMPVLNATVFARSETEGYSDQLNVQSLGAYRIALPDGTYNLFLQLQVMDPNVPVGGGRFITYDLQETVDVAGETQKDIVAPALPEFVTVSGRITNSVTLPMNGSLRVQTQAAPPEPGPVTMGPAGVAQIIDVISGAVVAFPAEGATETMYRFTVPVGTYDVTYMPDFLAFTFDPVNPVIPPPPTLISTASLSLGTLTVNGDAMQDFVVPDTVTLSGLVLDQNDMPLIPSTVTAVEGSGLLGETPGEQPPPQEPLPAPCSESLVATRRLLFSSSSQTLINTMGNYELTLVPGDYRVAVSTPILFEPLPTVLTRQILPPNEDAQAGIVVFPFLDDNVMSIMTSQEQNFKRPLLPSNTVISGMVEDADGNPVEKARVSATSSMITSVPEVFFSTLVETNADGTYQLQVLSGTDYRIEVCPAEEPENPINIPSP